jgi:hypothetical protein
MSLEWMDNFAIYGIGGEARMLNGLYAEIGDSSIVADPDPSGSGEPVLEVISPGGLGWRRVLGGTRTRVGIAMRLWMPDLSSEGDSRFLSFRDVSNAVLCDLTILTTGALRFRYDGLGSNIDTSGPVLIANAWQHVEIVVDFSTTVGEVEVRVEGVTVLTGDTLNTGAGCAQVASDIDETGFVIYQRDLVCYNGLGTLNNDFLGAVLVVSLDVTSDVSLNWTPSTGTTGYEILDNVPPVDTTYISAGDPPPAAYEGGLSNLPADVTSVKAVQTVVRAAKIDGGDGNLQVGIISGASTDTGADRPITTAFTYWLDVFETDPATGVAWTPVAVDAAEIQIDRTV